MQWAILLAAVLALAACTSSGGTDAGSECGNVEAGIIYTGTEVSTLAGGAHGPGGNHGGFVDGDAHTALFFAPSALAFDDGGYLYVADQGNNAIRRIDPQGNVTTFAGLGPDAGGFVDGNASTARFLNPTGVAIAPTNGTLYVADLNNHAVRRIDPQGNVTTLAGLGPNAGGFIDGNASVATFDYPTGVSVDGAGYVYVSDNNAIRKIDPQGNVTTLAGRLSFLLLDRLLRHGDPPCALYRAERHKASCASEGKAISTGSGLGARGREAPILGSQSRRSRSLRT